MKASRLRREQTWVTGDSQYSSAQQAQMYAKSIKVRVFGVLWKNDDDFIRPRGSALMLKMRICIESLRRE